jgi:predicted ArsR family transcriptional regulator
MSANCQAYPITPGYKAPGTSREAAQAMQGRAQRLRDQVLALLQSEELTADEAATKLGESVLSVRPRFSELHRMGLIWHSTKRRKNISGASAAVWFAAPATTI